jgi:hypothetical protein
MTLEGVRRTQEERAVRASRDLHLGRCERPPATRGGMGHQASLDGVAWELGAGWPAQPIGIDDKSAGVESVMTSGAFGLASRDDR